MDVVVVESPTKAKSIAKYLGNGFTVLPSYGHVRDLPEKDGSVLPDEDFRVIYEPLDEKKKRIDDIARALKEADRLILATDPDREGEAISWHLLELLRGKRAVKDKDVQRVVFFEVTKPAVLEAMARPRNLDENLIDAYQARRALDYLVGFTLSPVLWRKLQGSRSAGRVQSVALRLVCERESEIEAFRAQEYWTVEALLRTPAKQTFAARLVSLDGKKLDRFDLKDEATARRAVEAVEARNLAVAGIEKKQVQRGPAPPFNTAALQQEASRKLGFAADRTMRTAQRLFEGVELGGETVGLITYMRTDSVALSSEALGGCRRLIESRFGERYLPEKPRLFKTKTKNAQEAHEAIRPTDLFRTPQDVGRFLDDDQRRLYELIWKRTVASQMAAALLDRVTVEISSPDGKVGLRATGQTVAFDGFLKLYQEGRDDPTGDEDDEGRLLPPLANGDALDKVSVTPTQHFTEPPPRYTEASLVKRLEELGIGRPSTYAAILSTLQNRNYVRLEQKRFVPEDRGRLVNAFLVAFFDRYVQPGFTADLEDKLDGVAAGDLDWKTVLREFWAPFNGVVGEVKERRVADVIDALNDALAAKLFPPPADGGDPRVCPLCGSGRLSLKLGKFGAFVGCSNYPECRFTRRFGQEGQDAEAPKDRQLAEDVWLKNGRFGPYVQKGSGEEAKRASLPPNLQPDDLDLEMALRLLALPREIGRDRETNEPILAGIGRYGPYVQRGKQYVNLPPDEDVLTISDNRAIALLAEAAEGGRKGRRSAAPASALREMGPHPEDGEPVQVLSGRFGPYVKHGKLNASLPKGTTPETLTMDQAVALLQGRAERAGTGKGRKPPPKAKAAAAKKAPAASPDAAKKPAAKKAPVKTATGRSGKVRAGGKA
ncbi:MAG: type I DNA topoisomerase [Geminicoccaceae bacterium]